MGATGGRKPGALLEGSEAWSLASCSDLRPDSWVCYVSRQQVVVTHQIYAEHHRHGAHSTANEHPRRWLGAVRPVPRGSPREAGPAEIENACGRDVRLRLAGAVTEEAGTYPSSPSRSQANSGKSGRRSASGRRQGHGVPAPHPPRLQKASRLACKGEKFPVSDPYSRRRSGISRSAQTPPILLDRGFFAFRGVCPRGRFRGAHR